MKQGFHLCGCEEVVIHAGTRLPRDVAAMGHVSPCQRLHCKEAQEIHGFTKLDFRGTVPPPGIGAILGGGGCQAFASLLPSQSSHNSLQETHVVGTAQYATQKVSTCLCRPAEVPHCEERPACLSPSEDFLFPSAALEHFFFFDLVPRPTLICVYHTRSFSFPSYLMKAGNAAVSPFLPAG